MADLEEEHPVLDSEMKKKQLLVELESALAPGEKTVTAQVLGIEVIDETALLESVAKKQASSRRRGGTKNNHKKSELKSKLNKKYSRKELEALRFLNIPLQRKFWKSIHAALQTTVANEYDTLSSAPLLHNKPILSVAATNGRWRYMNVFVH